MRQSYPISPYIFIITAEILGIAIRRSDDVKGFKYKNAESKLNLNKSELIVLGHSKIEIHTHSFSPGIKITTDKFKLLGIMIPTNGKQKYLIFIIKKNIRNYKNLAKERFNSVWQTNNHQRLIMPQLPYALTILPSPGELFLNDIEKILLNVFLG